MISSTAALFMLTARRKSDGQTVSAYFEKKANGPFACMDCNEEVILKSGRDRLSHFAHANPTACKFAKGESETHRRCKMEIFLALQRMSSVNEVSIEQPVGMNRPDVSAMIDGVRVAVEIQLSDLSVEAIMQRTIEYGRNGIHVLWLLLGSPKLNANRYTPTQREK